MSWLADAMGWLADAVGRLADADLGADHPFGASMELTPLASSFSPGPMELSNSFNAELTPLSNSFNSSPKRCEPGAVALSLSITACPLPSL
jgi:hypothetical protein